MGDSILIDAYLKNVEAETFQFAFISFHMLYMSFIYKTIWFLKQENYGNVDDYIKEAKKDIPIDPSPFDFSIIDEAASFKILKALRFHSNELDQFSIPVRHRNHCSHASGKIQYSKKEIERLVSDELQNSEKILQKTKVYLEMVFTKFINENWDPGIRKYISPKEMAKFFIRKYLLSAKELELITSFSIPQLHESSNNRKNIYIKTLYLVFLYFCQTYIDIEENLLLKNLPLLMYEFDKQSEVSIEMLVNDEFSEILRDFNEKDKNAFAQITHYHLPDFL